MASQGNIATAKLQWMNESFIMEVLFRRVFSIHSIYIWHLQIHSNTEFKLLKCSVCWKCSKCLLKGILIWCNYTNFSYAVKQDNNSTICQHNRQITHYSDVIMSVMASQITGLTIAYRTVYLGADQRKHQSPASLAFMRGFHRWILLTKGQ